MLKLNPFKRDRFSTPAGQGLVAGIMEVCYIALVAIFMVGTQTFFATPRPWTAVFGIVAFLALLVLSVAVSGVIVFIWPVRYFLDKRYKESLTAFISTAATMFVIFAVIFIGLALFSAI